MYQLLLSVPPAYEQQWADVKATERVAKTTIKSATAPWMKTAVTTTLLLLLPPPTEEMPPPLPPPLDTMVTHRNHPSPLPSEHVSNYPIYLKVIKHTPAQLPDITNNKRVIHV